MLGEERPILGSYRLSRCTNLRYSRRSLLAGDTTAVAEAHIRMAELELNVINREQRAPKHTMWRLNATSSASPTSGVGC
jgi:hypothetical protein